MAISLNPKFCSDKQFFSCNTALFDSPANRLFVLVRSGSGNMAISSLNRVKYASFTFGQISYLKNTETKNRDFNAIVQFYILHNSILKFMLATNTYLLSKRANGWRYPLVGGTR